MKDALGHGSNERNASARVDYMRNRIGIAPGASFSRNVRQWAPESDTQRTVNRMRQQLASTPSAGHKRGLMQAIRNLLGG